MIALTVIVISILIVLLITPLVRYLGLKFGFVDHPGERKIHRQPMVRVGGIAICIGTFISLIAVWNAGELNQMPVDDILTVLGLAIGGLGFFAVGLSDDIFNLHPFIRLILQAVVSALAWSLGVRIVHLPIPAMGVLPLGMLSFPVTFLWLAGVANAVNWIDGMDGLAAGVAAIASLTLAVTCLQLHHSAIALIALALAGATIGFLRYNTTPARIFMGDGGSYFIGFVLAGIGITGLMSEATFTSTALPYIILAVPIVDMAFVILSRLLDGKSPFFPDQRHLHHRLLHLGFARPTTVWLIYGLTLWAGLSAITLTENRLGWIGVLFTIVLLGATNLQLWKQVAHLFMKRILLRQVAADLLNPAPQSNSDGY